MSLPMKIVFRVTDQKEWEAEVIKAPDDFPNEHRTFVISALEKYATGTVLTAEVTASRTGLLLDNMQVVEDWVDGNTTTPLPKASNAKEWIKQYDTWFSPEEYDLFHAMQRVMGDGQINLLILGSSGYGKTSRAKAWAEANEMSFCRTDVGSITDPQDFYGARDAVKGSTMFTLSNLAQLMIDGNVVVLLDEINRMQAWLGNALFPILDFERGITLYNQRIACGPGTFFMGTANVGMAYAGTFASDAALTNRWDATIVVYPPPPEVEMDIIQTTTGVGAKEGDLIVNVLNTLRSTGIEEGLLDISTRCAKKLARLVTGGLTVRQAAEFTIVNNAPKDDDALLKDVLDIVNTTLGKLK